MYGGMIDIAEPPPVDEVAPVHPDDAMKFKPHGRRPSMVSSHESGEVTSPFPG